jgi:hypothetical protein
METAIVSIVCIALILIGGMTMSQGFLTSVDTTSTGLEEMAVRDEKILRTELSPVTANASLSGSRLYLTLANSGQTKLADYDMWDVIIQYYDNGASYHTKWLPYTGESSPGDNEWRKEGIYLDTDNKTAEIAEVFEPYILNPGEKIKIEAKLNPAVGANTTNLAVVSTPSGVPVSVTFSGPP